MQTLKNKRHIQYWNIPILILGIGMFCFSCKQEQAAGIFVEVDPSGAQEEFENITINYTEHGKPQARIFGKVLDRYERNDSSHVEITDSLHMHFYDSLGRVESWIVAGYGIIFDYNGKMILKDSVVLINESEGHKLETDVLVWQQNEKYPDSNRIYTPPDQLVRITDDDFILSGYGMEADERFEHYQLNDIHGTIFIDEEEGF